VTAKKNLFIRWLNKIPPQVIVLVAILFVAIICRVWLLGQPSAYVYDEVYYVKYAKMFLSGKYWIDVHPALGDVIIAIGIKIFGDHSWAWRLLAALAGIAIIPLSYSIASRIFKNRWIGVITAFLLTFDGLMLVQSRTALLDIFMTFFVLCAYFFYLKYREKQNLAFLAACGLTLGLALATKWVAAPFWIIIIGWFIWDTRKTPRRLWWGLLFLIILPAAIYILSFLLYRRRGAESFWAYLKYWHIRTLKFHYYLRSPHAYESRWYTWPILYQPVWYLKTEMSDGTVSAIVTLGNPLIWLTSIIAFFYSIYLLFFKRFYAVLIPLLSFSLFYFSWAVIKRPEFVYYIVPALPFYFMLCAFFIMNIYKKYKIIGAILLIAVAAFFLFFYPIAINRPISQTYMKSMIWLKSWQIKPDKNATTSIN